MLLQEMLNKKWIDAGRPTKEVHFRAMLAKKRNLNLPFENAKDPVNKKLMLWPYLSSLINLENGSGTLLKCLRQVLQIPYH